MNYFEYLNKKITANSTSFRYTEPVNNMGVNPFATTPIFSNNTQNVNLNGVSIFTSANKEDLSKIDYEKILANEPTNSGLSPLEFVLKEFLSIDKIKKSADKNGDGVISQEEAREFIEELAAKDGNSEILSLEDFEQLIKEEGINLESLSNFLNNSDSATNVTETVDTQNQNQTQPVQNTTSQNSSNISQNAVTAPQQAVTKTIENMTLPELKEEKEKRTATISKKRAELSAARNGENPAVKQAKTQADQAKKKYESLLKQDPAAKKFAKQVLKNNKQIEKNQTELDKIAEEITTKETEISEKEANITSSEKVLSSLENALHSLPAPSGKPEDKDKDTALNNKKSELTKEISEKKKEIEKQKSDLDKANKSLEKLNNEKNKLEAEKKELQTEKKDLDNLVKTNCSSEVKAALEAFNAATKNAENIKIQETNKAQKAFDIAKNDVTEINAKISQQEAEDVKDKYSSTSGTVDKAVELAESQVGVSENGSSNDSAEIRKYKNGKVDGNPWCASFVSWLYGSGQNSKNGKTFGYTASSQEIKNKAQRANCYASKNSNYVPKKGDLAMWTKSASTGHVGIVSKVYPDGSFDTIEGNSKNAVTKHHYSSKYSVGSGFDGFVQMNKWVA